MSNRIANEGPILRSRLVTVNGTPVLIRQLPDDPESLRVSLGGERGKGFYLVYRGSEQDIEHLLEVAFAAYRSAAH